MKIKKLVYTLIWVIICILIIQICSLTAILILSGIQNNSMVVNIASISIIVLSFTLAILLAELFELFTGRSFGEMQHRFYSFDKPRKLDSDDKNWYYVI